MGQLVIDSNMHAVLSRVKGQTELRDAQGKLVGVFIPAGDTLFDESEIQGALQTLKREWNQGNPKEKVLRSLESLGKSQ